MSSVDARDEPQALSPTASSPQDKRALVPITDGSCGLDVSCICTTLGKFGAQVVLASVSSTLVCETSCGNKIHAKMTIQDASSQHWDLIVLPGGVVAGIERMRGSTELMSMLDQARNEESPHSRLYGACGDAASLVLAAAGCPTSENYDVTVQGNIVTCQGSGAALIFALQLGELLYDKEAADFVARKMLVDRYGNDRPPRGEQEMSTHSSVDDENTNAEMSVSLSGTKKKQLPETIVIEENEDGRETNERSGKGSKRAHSDETAAKATRKRRQHWKDDELEKQHGQKTISGKIFDKVVWPRLLALGWREEKGQRRDIWFFPPGVYRGRGARSRVDFFDSRLQVMECVEKNTQWHNLSQVREACTLAAICARTYSSMMHISKKKRDQKGFDLDWLVREAERSLVEENTDEQGTVEKLMGKLLER